MIEDEELGLKIAENSDEAFWNETKEQTLKAIENHKRNQKIAEKILELCEEQLKLCHAYIG